MCISVRVSLLIIALVAIQCNVNVVCGAPLPRIENVEIGFNGVYKVGQWTPVWITIGSIEALEVFRLGAERLHATRSNGMWCPPWSEPHGDDPVEA